MLLLLADSILMIFITVRIGILAQYLLEKTFRVTIQTDLLGIFLGGLIACSIYFNIFSFWIPVNYLSLLPLLIAGVFIGLVFREKDRQIRQRLLLCLRFVFSRANLSITLCLIGALFIFWIIPPGNPDSAGYHYQSILWFEKYKVVPGLANINGRFAFNPISFLIQAAYSFTGPVGQSIYPLNGVIFGLLFFWLLLRVLRRKNSPSGLIYSLLIILLCRTFLLNLSSPTSDGLVDVCMVYVLIFLSERLLSGEAGIAVFIMPCLIILFSLTAKLSSFPLLPLLPFLFFTLPRNEKNGYFFLRVFGICLLVFVPWLIRNYILSGYLIYPLPWINFFHPDWQVSFNVLRLDYYLIHEVTTKATSIEAWVSYVYKHEPIHLLFEFGAVISPFWWILFRKRMSAQSLKAVGIWLITYIGVWIWCVTSPVFRFGAVFVFLAMLLPFIAIVFKSLPHRPKLYSSFISLVFVFAAVHYIKSGIERPSNYAFGLKDCWLYPLKDRHYKNNKADFSFTTLHSGVRLYMEDRYHECLNADLTCSQYYIGQVEMRGERIDQGFKTVKDETLPYFPYVK